MKKYAPQTRYCCLQAFIWGTYGILVCYSNVYLLGLGLSNTLASLCLAVASSLSVAVTPLLTGLTARLKHLTGARVLYLLAGLMAGVTLGIFLLSPPVALGVGLFCAAVVCLHIVPGFANSLGMTGIRQGLRVNFGVARGIGSVSYALVSLAAGKLIETQGLWVIPLLSGILALGVFLFTAAFSRAAAGASELPAASEKQQGLFQAQPRFLLFLTGCVSLFVSHNLLTNFMYQIVVSKGGGTAQQGVVLSLAAALELPIMFLFGRMLRWRRCDQWVKLSALFFALRALGMLLVSTVGGCLAVQLTQALGFALYTVASAYYVSATIPAAYELQAQAYLHATSTLGSILSLLMGGMTLDCLGVGAHLTLSVIFGALGYGIFLLSVRPVDRASGT